MLFRTLIMLFTILFMSSRTSLMSLMTLFMSFNDMDECVNFRKHVLNAMKNRYSRNE